MSLYSKRLVNMTQAIDTILQLNHEADWLPSHYINNAIIDRYYGYALTFSDNLDFLRRKMQYIIDTHKEYYNRVWELSLIEYNPIENYSMTEQGTDRHCTQNINRHGEYSSNELTSNTHNENVQDGSAYGYNDGQQPISKQTENNTQKAGSNARGNMESTDKGAEMGKTIHEFKRSGNIGVTTSQQMLSSEKDLQKWLKLILAEYVELFKDCFMLVFDNEFTESEEIDNG